MHRTVGGAGRNVEADFRERLRRGSLEDTGAPKHPATPAMTPPSSTVRLESMVT